MLTYTPNPKPKRKDRPWLLFLMALIWISGSCFFHDPWEPYEPYVVAIVKSIIETNSWLVPYLSSPSVPYLELQPFYFWIFAVIIKIFNFSNIANAVRLLNALIILVFIMLMGRIGSGLSAFKNGRTVVMILISMVGFINNAYQLSPHLIVLALLRLLFTIIIISNPFFACSNSLEFNLLSNLITVSMVSFPNCSSITFRPDISLNLFISFKIFLTIIIFYYKYL